MNRIFSLFIGTSLAAFASVAACEEIAVGNYGVSANGMPFGVALVKGYFKDEGLNITGLISSAGGGTSLRNMLAGGGVPYGEVNPGVVVSAIQAGADLKIVSDNVLTVAEFVWAVKPDSPIKSIKDFKGKKIGYTNPRSTSQALARMLLQAGGYTEADAELVKTGGFGEGIAALDAGLIDVAAITEPLWSKVKNKYRAVVVASEVLPPLDNVVGVTTVEMAEKRGDFIRAVIRARRKAVQFMIAHPDEAAEIVAKQYNIELDVAKSAVRNLTTSKTNPYGRPEADDRSAALGRRDHRRGRLQQDHRHEIPARRSQGNQIEAVPKAAARPDCFVGSSRAPPPKYYVM